MCFKQRVYKRGKFFKWPFGYPQYTRPEVFEGEKVPDILLSGNHQNIDKWRKQKSLEIIKK